MLAAALQSLRCRRRRGSYGTSAACKSDKAKKKKQVSDMKKSSLAGNFIKDHAMCFSDIIPTKGRPVPKVTCWFKKGLDWLVVGIASNLLDTSR